MLLWLAGISEVLGTLIIWLYKGAKKSILCFAIGLITIGFISAFIYAYVNNLSVIVIPK